MINAVVYDLFGTLLDIRSLRDAVARVVEPADDFVARWRDKQISYSFQSAITGAYVPFDAITTASLDYVADLFGVTLSADDRGVLTGAWSTLSPYDDAVAALTAVRAMKIPQIVLTNGSKAMARDATRNAGLDTLLDDVLSVDDVRVYKPSAAVYRMAVERFGVSPDEIAFVSSNGWDASGAAGFGFRVIWCNRARLPKERFGPAPAEEVSTLARLPELIP